KEKKAFYTAILVMLLSLIRLDFWVAPNSAAWRDANCEVTSLGAPLMRSIVPLSFIVFLIPGVVYGLMSGVFKNSKDIVMSMSKPMASMSHYIAIAFFCARCIDSCGQSNIDALLSLKGASAVQAMQLPPEVIMICVIFFIA